MDGPMAHWSRLVDMNPEWDYCRQTFFRGDTLVLTTWRAAGGSWAASVLGAYEAASRPGDGSDKDGVPKPLDGARKPLGLLWRRDYRAEAPLSPGGLEEAHWHLVAQIVAGRLPPG